MTDSVSLRGKEARELQEQLEQLTTTLRRLPEGTRLLTLNTIGVNDLQKELNHFSSEGEYLYKETEPDRD
jgi:hypothetical protein